MFSRNVDGLYKLSYHDIFQKYLSLYCMERLALHDKIYPSYGAELMYAAKVAKDREAKKERQLPPVPYPG